MLKGALRQKLKVLKDFEFKVQIKGGNGLNLLYNPKAKLAGLVSTDKVMEILLDGPIEKNTSAASSSSQ